MENVSIKSVNATMAGLDLFVISRLVLMNVPTQVSVKKEFVSAMLVNFI